MHLFFSDITVHHRSRLPESGPVLLVANHHSGLVDPALLIATMPRTPRFLAKASLWSLKYLPLRPLLQAAKALPVHRQAEGGGDNSQTFGASQEALESGDVIALFGEGKSHDEPGLLELRTGAARIALGANTTVTILPVGLIFPDRATYRSPAAVWVGQPMKVHGTNGGAEDRERVRALTNQIAEDLDHAAPSWATWQTQRNAIIAAQLTVADAPNVDLTAALAAVNRGVDAELPEAEHLMNEVEELRQECSAAGIDVEAFADQPHNHTRRRKVGSFLKSALWILPTLLGRLLNLPPFVAVDLLARSQNLNFRASAKILLGVFLYPTWWLTAAGMVGVLSRSSLGVLTLLALPALGYVAARQAARFRRFRNRRSVTALMRRQAFNPGLQDRRISVVEATRRLSDQANAATM